MKFLKTSSPYEALVGLILMALGYFGLADLVSAEELAMGLGALVTLAGLGKLLVARVRARKGRGVPAPQELDNTPVVALSGSESGSESGEILR